MFITCWVKVGIYSHSLAHSFIHSFHPCGVEHFQFNNLIDFPFLHLSFMLSQLMLKTNGKLLHLYFVSCRSLIRLAAPTLSLCAFVQSAENSARARLALFSFFISSIQCHQRRSTHTHIFPLFTLFKRLFATVAREHILINLSIKHCIALCSSAEAFCPRICARFVHASKVLNC